MSDAHAADAEENRSLRDELPDEIYASEADFVTVAMKTMTAERLVGWLREYAEYCRIAGSTKTAEHADVVANRLAAEVDPDRVEAVDLEDTNE